MLVNFLQSKRIYLFLSGGLLLLIGFFIGRATVDAIVIKPKVLRETGYEYIKPILLCNTDYQQEYNNDTDLTKTLNDFVKKSKVNSSIYYLNITNGKWASINETMTFSPASMLKVPTIVDILKFAESNPDILNKEVYFDGSFDDNKAESFPSTKYIKPGRSYTISELLDYTIEESDNNASRLLHANINSRSLEEIYKDLDITIPQNTTDYMSAKTYTLFLRVLYNSTYLTREFSERTLEMMAKSSFHKGIKAGVPSSQKVASKFGEREVYSSTGEVLRKELHECGIVYGEKENYILCVMTKGENLDKLASFIADISRLVYTHTNQ